MVFPDPPVELDPIEISVATCDGQNGVNCNIDWSQYGGLALESSIKEPNINGKIILNGVAPGFVDPREHCGGNGQIAGPYVTREDRNGRADVWIGIAPKQGGAALQPL